MTPAQLQILQHSIGADEFGQFPKGNYRNHFVTDPSGADGVVCESLVALGLMTRKDSHPLLPLGDAVYHVTEAGRATVAQESRKPPKRTRSQQRYEEYQQADSGLSFIEWLKRRKQYQR